MLAGISASRHLGWFSRLWWEPSFMSIISLSPQIDDFRVHVHCFWVSLVLKSDLNLLSLQVVLSLDWIQNICLLFNSILCIVFLFGSSIILTAIISWHQVGFHSSHESLSSTSHSSKVILTTLFCIMLYKSRRIPRWFH